MQPQSTNIQEKLMNHYALIFHSTRTFTPEEQKQRTLDIADWVKQVTEMGITLDPRNFGETAASFPSDGSKTGVNQASGGPALATIVFFDTADREQAVEIARIHPALHYGVNIEVREWTSPRGVLVTQ
jgi:hypothetical protein